MSTGEPSGVNLSSRIKEVQDIGVYVCKRCAFVGVLHPSADGGGFGGGFAVADMSREPLGCVSVIFRNAQDRG